MSLNSRSKRGITVVDVCRDLGIEPLPELTWAVGNEMRDLYYQRHGVLPEKDLRTKTNGSGSHCLAVYSPDEMYKDIKASILRHACEKARHGDLFLTASIFYG